jgi:hypothetical protein
VPGSQYKDQLLFNSFIGIRIDGNIFESVSKMSVSKGAYGFGWDLEDLNTSFSSTYFGISGHNFLRAP